MMKPNFSETDHRTWRELFTQQAVLREKQLIPEFGQGLKLLGITADRIPDLDEVNSKLKKLTGWQAVYVDGFVDARDFFQMLSDKKFPVGSFIRDAKDLSYTPAPDVFHDLYGHIPFYTIPEYANFCEQFGTVALKYAHDQKIIDEFQRLFWFTVEFALVKTANGTRIFGAGIASSFGECAYALSGKPKVHAFDPEVIRNKDFRIDIMQEDLFILESAEQLYHCLNEFIMPYRRNEQLSVS